MNKLIFSLIAALSLSISNSTEPPRGAVGVASDARLLCGDAVVKIEAEGPGVTGSGFNMQPTTVVRSASNVNEALTMLEASGWKPLTMAIDDSAAFGWRIYAQKGTARPNAYGRFTAGNERQFAWNDGGDTVEAGSPYALALAVFDGRIGKEPAGLKSDGLVGEAAFMELMLARGWDVFAIGDRPSGRVYWFRKPSR